MRFLLCLLLACATLTGCQNAPKWFAKSVKYDNPVVGPPPPRMSRSEQQLLAQQRLRDPESDYAQVHGTRSDSIDGSAFPDAINATQLVATVNGEPIFAGELIGRYKAQFEVAREKLSPERFQEERLKAIHSELGPRIDRLVLTQAMKTQLKQEQIDQINAQLDSAFEKQIEEMKANMNVSTTVELEHQLAASGESLQNLRNEFGNQQLAIEYIRSQSQAPKRDFNRDDLYTYYQTHLEEFTIPARVQWQKISIAYSKHGGKSNAFSRLDEVINALRSGRRFSDIAKEYSDDLSAEDGGFWNGWMSQNTLANKDLEQALFELPVGQISTVFEEPSQFTLVRVVKRERERLIPFAEKQDEIRQKLVKSASGDQSQVIIKELKDKAIIEVFVEEPKPVARPGGFGR